MPAARASNAFLLPFIYRQRGRETLTLNCPFVGAGPIVAVMVLAGGCGASQWGSSTSPVHFNGAISGPVRGAWLFWGSLCSTGWGLHLLSLWGGRPWSCVPGAGGMLQAECLRLSVLSLQLQSLLAAQAL